MQSQGGMVRGILDWKSGTNISAWYGFAVTYKATYKATTICKTFEKKNQHPQMGWLAPWFNNFIVGLLLQRLGLLEQKTAFCHRVSAIVPSYDLCWCLLDGIIFIPYVTR
mmetsp:Transcript_2958/g.2973  ORF Transcript_2958/g.2973 Transcript_2958/m.2973 type:complete len:110 (+) Transcript_2958:15-344(+)